MRSGQKGLTPTPAGGKECGGSGRAPQPQTAGGMVGGGGTG